MYTVVVKQNGKTRTEDYKTLSDAEERIVELESDFESPLSALILDNNFNVVSYEHKCSWSNMFKPVKKVRKWKIFKPGPCPYCGSAGVLEYAYFGQWEGCKFRVECSDSECRGNPTPLFTTPEEALDNWMRNR